MVADKNTLPPAAPRIRRDAVRRGQHGMTLIEVMVSIVLVSIGMVGLLGLLASTMQTSTSAQDRNRAALLANEMVTAMWLNNSTNVALAPLSTDYANWQASLANGLYPNAVGTVTAGAGNAVTISITWTQPNQAASRSSNTVNTYGNQVVNNTYTTQVSLP